MHDLWDKSIQTTDLQNLVKEINKLTKLNFMSKEIMNKEQYGNIQD
jgi:hypothetical protein